MIPVESIAIKIYFIRDHRVILGRDLAELYGVETGQLKRAVRRNIDRFPSGFMFVLTKKELEKTSLKVQLEEETVWLTQNQLAELFGSERSVITKHINNIFKSPELKKNSVCAKFAHTASDGKIYQTNFYNLDVIIAVGYRVNAQRGTQFRIWATSVLKEYLIKGYTVNERRLAEKGLLEMKQIFL